ncbi:GNAT family N-acetyltransferase [Actinomadura parmotrematis]|uniref:GNAT family N-acetyltransferase n=1 Tax=Actinomadura parmotrematis TaxID=2864039 RepID=A0ABS7FNF1_9ACTN|nr:GNAT family N-acetyltransferase [Actinomadura parmotrematis]MBW8481088.1 GNAT family N-acetyltransferase [Actinomadura parmotrematis]
MPTRRAEVTTWHLEQNSPADLRPAREPDAPVRIERAETAAPEFARFLYTAVGGDWHWTDRLAWTRDQWHNWLTRPGAELWTAYLHGTPAGYAELDPHPAGEVEIAYFGLLRAFHGRGLGGHLLTHALRRAWDLADRWPAREPTRRVRVRTCSLDGPAALANYQARGLRVHDISTTTETVPVY